MQFGNFETGEFVDEKYRTYEETIRLINSYPWESQRHGNKVAMTNPSVTIDRNDKDYLKLSLFYNGKFVLYYLDQKKVLFTKSYSDLVTSFKDIKCYFESSHFDTSDFKKQNTLTDNNEEHFVTKNLSYEVSKRKAKAYLLSTSVINFSFAVLMLLIFMFKRTTELNIFAIMLLSSCTFYMGGGLNIIVFFNYYFYSRDKILIMSKGNNISYFGKTGDVTQYDKADILSLEVSRVRGSKHPLASFSITTIELSDGRYLDIPNIFLNKSDLHHKLSQIPTSETYRIPIL